VTDEVVYLSAMEEAKYTIAQANATVDSRLRRVTTNWFRAARAATS
jgi:DNA-directed RNA polymerase beta subunit